MDFNNEYFKNYDDDNKDDVLPLNETFEYDWKFNLSKGAISSLDIDYNDKENIDNIIKLLKPIINDGFCSVDIIKTKDSNFYVMEINSGVMMQNFIKQNENGYMIVRIDGEYKYYNFRFEEKTNIELLKSNTLFLSKLNDKYGFVNKDGIVIVDYIYDDATEQNRFGYSSVKKDGKWGVIDSKGKEVVKPQYTMENNSLIEFIDEWHLGEDLNLNYYTK